MFKFFKNLKEAYAAVKAKGNQGEKVISIDQLKTGSRIFINKSFENCLGQTYKPDSYTIEELDIGTDLDADLRHKSGVDLSPIWMDLSSLIKAGNVTFEKE